MAIISACFLFIASSSLMSAHASESPFHYGVEWNDQVTCAAHCWLPYSSDEVPSRYACKHAGCADSRPNPILPLVECPTCSLIVHTQHVLDSFLPPCRLSFVDAMMAEETSLYDRHHWSSVSVLPRECLSCRSRANGSTNFKGLVCLWCSRTYHQQCWQAIADNDPNANHCDYGPYG